MPSAVRLSDPSVAPQRTTSATEALATFAATLRDTDIPAAVLRRAGKRD